MGPIILCCAGHLLAPPPWPLQAAWFATPVPAVGCFPPPSLPENEAEDPIPQGLTRDVEVYFLHPSVSLRYQPQPQMAIVLFKHRVDEDGAVGASVSQDLNSLRVKSVIPRLSVLIENETLEVLGDIIIFIVAVQGQVFQRL